MTYYSQNGEDKWLVENWSRLSLPDCGFFVEVGVGDGTTISNSLWLEQRGWDGLLIEPDTRNHDAIRSTRKARLVPLAVGGHARPFVLADNPELSGFLRKKNEGMVLTVTVSRLDEILDAEQVEHVDIISIDTEGTEVEVWDTLDLKRWRPKVAIIEWYSSGIGEFAAQIKRRLAVDGYECVATLGCNLIFTPKS